MVWKFWGMVLRHSNPRESSSHRIIRQSPALITLTFPSADPANTLVVSNHSFLALSASAAPEFLLDLHILVASRLWGITARCFAWHKGLVSSHYA